MNRKALSIALDNKGRLTTLEANKHLIVTLKLKKTSLTATATLGEWTVKNLETDGGDDDTSGAQK